MLILNIPIHLEWRSRNWTGIERRKGVQAEGLAGAKAGRWEEWGAVSGSRQARVIWCTESPVGL